MCIPVTGAPLHVRGKRYGKGIGCHSRSEMTWQLEGGYQGFVAERRKYMGNQVWD